MTALRAFGSAAVVMALVSGCGLLTGEPSPPSAPATTTVPPATSPASMPPATSASPPAPTSAATAGLSPSQTPSGYSDAPTSHKPLDAHWDYQFDNVRVGQHEQYDRVVIDLSGHEAAGLSWWVEYTDEALTQGRGDIVEFSGDAILAVRLQGIGYPPEDEVVLQGVLDDSAHGNVSGVYVDPVFEAMVQVFIGLDRQRDFHVMTLDSPTRLVVDIKR